MTRKLLALLLAFAGMVAAMVANAQLAPIPPNIVSTAPKPVIMLNMSKDHQLFYRAYDEYSDLDGDGLPETTYKHSFDYYGYFDSYKCYVYDGTNGRFEPSNVTTNKYCTAKWSGNFLNWATMARVDVLRKVLYGGYRSSDTSALTVLERTHLPTDAHSFAKYYKGDDLDNLTPFTAEQLAPSGTSSTQRRMWYDSTRDKRYQLRKNNNNYDSPDGSTISAISSQNCASATMAALNLNTITFAMNCMTFATSFTAGQFEIAVGDQVRVESSSSTSTYAVGVAVEVGSGAFTMIIEPTAVGGTSSSSVISSWTIKNLSQISATICNTTLGDGNGYSHNNANPPLMRIARGDYQLWNANERWQCYWSGEKTAANGNNYNITGLGSSSSNPSASARGVTISGNGPDFNVRVKVCDSTLIGRERCKQYPSGAFKPIGLLHEYGEAELAEFGLITGSFAKNISGGVVRSNVQTFRNEVNWDTNGTFTSNVGIVKTLDRLRVYGYNYSDGTYESDNNCTYQLTGLTDNKCTSWGNPIGEMYLEALKYLAGKSASSAFTYTQSGSKDAAMNLPQPAWVDPFLRSSTAERNAVETKFGKAQCRPINILNFNASVTSYDHDQLSGFSALTGSTTVDTLMNLIGQKESIHGSSWFVGSNGTNNDRSCTAKTVGALADVRGVCPDGPAYFGGYGLPALSYWAHTNAIRNDISNSGNAAKAFKVNTYSVALAPGKPRIEVPHPTLAGRKVVIQPAYSLVLNGSPVGGGTLVDFRIISQSATSGKYLVIWEDSEQGGDYDQDASGVLQWEIVNGKLYVYTQTFADATANPQGFGYTISGTNKDGLHFHSGILNYNYSDNTNLTVVSATPGNTSTTATHANINSSGGCSNCSKNQGFTRAEYAFSNSAPAGILQDPMWFAAKWGGFKDEPPTGFPDATAKWDAKRTNGTLGSDGVPDNYFIAYRADQLEQSLRSVFDDIVSSSNTAPAVASAQITDGSLKYVAKFDGVDGHGELQAFELMPTGSFNTVPQWNAHELLTNAGGRQIMTNVGTTGVPFLWANLPNAQKLAHLGGTDAEAQAKLLWIRGDRSNESPNGYRFRRRNSNSIMGPVISSNPHVQAPPRAVLAGPAFAGYTAFKTQWQDRQPVIWVGSGDGMLHGFSSAASTTSTTGTLPGGTPIMSYVPGMLLARTATWPDPSSAAVQALVEGTVFTGDVTTNTSGSNTWATYLFGSLGRGGKGIFALDVTDTGQLNEANAASIFRWQFTDSDDADLGYTLYEGSATNRFSRQPGQIARMNNGRFAALFGNGVESTSGKAALFILFPQGPNNGSWAGRYVKLVADTGPNNGLSQPMWVDVDGDGIADYIYAGDLKGNLWKFDVTNADPAQWGVAYQGKPLYTAKNTDAGTTRLPISSVSEFRFHPQGGIVVLFGTGKAVTDADFPDSTRTNGIYGIWDNPAFATMNASQLDTNLPRLRSQLQSRTMNRQSDGSSYITGGAVNWTTHKGWYINFPESSEMTLANPSMVQGLLAVVSVVPNAAGTDNCFGLPSAYLTLVDPITGMLSQNVMGTTTASGVTYNIASSKLGDQRVTVVRVRMSTTPGGKSEAGAVGATSFQKWTFDDRSSRVFWREIPTLRTLP